MRPGEIDVSDIFPVVRHCTTEVFWSEPHGTHVARCTYTVRGYKVVVVDRITDPNKMELFPDQIWKTALEAQQVVARWALGDLL